MVTSQTSACLLPCLILGHTVLHCAKITDSLTGFTLCKVDASTWNLIFQLRLRNLHIAGNLVTNDLNIIHIPFKMEIEKQPWSKDFPLIRDSSKCIKCMRCIQVCDKVQIIRHSLQTAVSATDTGYAFAVVL